MRLRHLQNRTRRLALAGSIALLLCLGQRSEAQLAPADDFFHRGALFYLSNNIPRAWEQVTNGRAIYPDDIKLKKLEELLKQQDQQQKSQSKSGGGQNNSQSQQQTNSNPSEPQHPDQKQDTPNSDSQPKDQQSEQPENATVKYEEGEMTPQQARRLLDAQKNDETVLPVKPDQKAAARRGPIKDW